jgi:hypothetical protein
VWIVTGRTSSSARWRNQLATTTCGIRLKDVMTVLLACGWGHFIVLQLISNRIMDQFKIPTRIHNELISSSWFDSAGDLLRVQGTAIGGALRSEGSLVPV